MLYLHHNSLNQFRLYGKTDNIEGSGISLVVNCKMFSNWNFSNHISINNAITYNNARKNTNIDEKIPIFRCIYIDPDNGYISVAKRNKYYFYLECENPEEEFNKYIKEISVIEKEVSKSLQKIKHFYKKLKNIKINKKLNNDINNFLEVILLPIRYLIKHASFEEEAECRILYIKDIRDPMLRYENNRVYIPYPILALNKNINNNKTYLEKIYLGPKAHKTTKAGLQYLYHKSMNSLYPGEIYKELEVVESKLPLA